MSEQCTRVCVEASLTGADGSANVATARAARLRRGMSFLWALLSGLGVPMILSRCGGSCGSCGQCAPVIASIPLIAVVLARRRGRALVKRLLGSLLPRRGAAGKAPMKRSDGARKRLRDPTR